MIEKIKKKFSFWSEERSIPAGILLIMLALTFFTWWESKKNLRKHQEEVFIMNSENASYAISSRLQDYIEILQGAKGLQEISDTVTRNDWYLYYRSLEIERNYPGMLALAYSRYLKKDNLPGLVSQIEKEGFKGFEVFPDYPRDYYTVITLIEPFSGRNLRAFGYDMMTESRRKTAMVQAVENNKPSMSEGVKLVQETGQDIQKGFLIYIPVYSSYNEGMNVPERWNQLKGFVYGAFRIKDFLKPVMDKHYKGLQLEVFDGDSAIERNLLFSNMDRINASDFMKTRSINVAGRTWLLKFHEKPLAALSEGADRPLIILVTGIIITLLLSGLFYVISNTREKAMEIAEELTRRLKESEEQFKAVAETAREAIITANWEGKIIYFNKGAEIIFGYHYKDVLGKEISMLVPLKYKESHREGFQHFKNTGEGRIIGKTVEVSGLTRNGSEVPIEISLSNWKTSKGSFFTAIIRDISERKKTEAQLIAKTEELKRSNRDLENFAMVASHDLQEPLRTISSYLQLLEMRLKEKIDEDTSGFINTIINASKRMKLLINNLLEYSRINAHTNEFVPVDLNPLLEKVLQDLDPTIKNVEAEIIIPKLPVVSGIPSQLGQLFQNLISNALKFRKTDQRPVIEIGVRRNGNEYLFSCADNGIGIEPEYRHKIFEIFQRLHTREKFSGTGIGLSICKKIVENHGGTIWVDSSNAGGSVFYFTLTGTNQIV